MRPILILLNKSDLIFKNEKVEFFDNIYNKISDFLDTNYDANLNLFVLNYKWDQSF